MDGEWWWGRIADPAGGTPPADELAVLDKKWGFIPDYESESAEDERLADEKYRGRISLSPPRREERNVGTVVTMNK